MLNNVSIKSQDYYYYQRYYGARTYKSDTDEEPMPLPSSASGNGAAEIKTGRAGFTARGSGLPVVEGGGKRPRAELYCRTVSEGDRAAGTQRQRAGSRSLNHRGIIRKYDIVICEQDDVARTEQIIDRAVLNEGIIG